MADRGVGMRKERSVEYGYSHESENGIAIIDAVMHLVVHDIRCRDLPLGRALAGLVANLAGGVRRMGGHRSYAAYPCCRASDQPPVLADQGGEALECAVFHLVRQLRPFGKEHVAVR